MSQAAEKILTRGQIAAFVIPKFAFGLILAPFFYVLPSFYAQNTAVTLAVLGSILAFTRLTDAFIDPLMGIITDRTKTRFGPRKPWYVAGATLMGIAIWFLFHPTAETTGTYFLIWTMLFFLGWTMFDIPADAWLTELTGSYRGRARIVGLQGFASQAGSFLFFLVSLSGLTGAGMSAGLFSATGWAALVLLPAFALVAAIYAPAGKPVAIRKPDWRTGLKAMVKNGPLRIYLISQILGGLGGGIYLSTQIFMLDGYFGLGAYYGLIFIAHQVTYFVSFPLWMKIIYRYGKHRTWACSTVASGAAAPLVLLMPSDPSALPWLIALAVFRALLSGADTIVPRAVMADACDYGLLKTGENSAGSYFALSSLIIKGTAALANGLAFWLLAAFAFEPKAGAANAPEAIGGLLFVAVAVPFVFNLLSGFIWFFPIDERRSGIIRRRIESRAARAAVSETT